MKKWCGIEKSISGEKYRIIVPMTDGYIKDDMMITNGASGRILTKWIYDIEEAKKACMEFNMLHAKYN